MVDELPLAGRRILDFGQVFAGPLCGAVVAALGADVIKVESKRRPDSTRRKKLSGVDQKSANPTSPSFHGFNHNKRSILLDLTIPAARDVALRLGASCDAVIASFRPGVLARLGLSYAAFSSLRPDIIMIEVSGSGQIGPEARFASYAPIFAALGGVSDLTGYEDGIPTEWRGPVDLRIGWTAALGLVAALVDHSRTGRGSHIDLSGREVMSATIGDLFLAAQSSSEVLAPAGNNDGVASPSDCFLCADGETWVAISIQGQKAWDGICELAGRDWHKDRRFADAYLRWVNRHDLSREVANWVATQDAEALVARLQAVGASAVISVSTEHLMRDEHLAARSVFIRPDGVASSIVLPRLPWLESSRTWVREFAPGPALGEDSEPVLKEAGYSAHEISELRASGALE